MNKEQRIEKLSSLIQNKDFVLKLAATKSDAEAMKLFADNGCELSADKVNFIRNTLNSLLKGDIKISEEDLENVSGGKIDTTKVVAVTLAATLAIGGTAWAVSSHDSSQQQQQNQGGGWGKTLGKIFGPAVAAGLRTNAQPTWGDIFGGWFSRNKRTSNNVIQTLGDGAASAIENLGK